MELLHFNGPIWRPPFEATSQLLQVTAGCTHNRCKFCSLYEGQPFRMSPLSEIEEDLQVIWEYQPRARRVFLTGANPFALRYDRLLDIGLLIRKYLREGMPTIGCFARITDIKRKTVEELKNLRHLGYDYISIGTESGDNDTLEYMHKGYDSEEIIHQCKKLQDAGIHYNLTYLTGLAGKGKGIKNALKTAKVYSNLLPASVNLVSLTIFPGSVLYEEVKNGRYEEAGEHERIEELIALIKSLTCRTHIIGNTVSNPATLTGSLPTDRNIMINILREAENAISEESLRDYRDGIRSL